MYKMARDFWGHKKIAPIKLGSGAQKSTPKKAIFKNSVRSLQLLRFSESLSVIAIRVTAFMALAQ